MVDQIDELKRKYTDKYVVVDGERPELARFRDTYGTVKTVNMSGRALVEFADYHLNIGWYDIDPSYLKLIDAPLPPKAEGSPRQSPRREKAPRRGRFSGWETRRQGHSPPPANPPPPTSSPNCVAVAAPPPNPLPRHPPRRRPSPPHQNRPPSPAGKVDRSKMSVADMLAAARAGKAGGGRRRQLNRKRNPSPSKKSPKKSLAGEPASAGGEPAESVAKSSGETPDKKSMTIDQMIAWCREHDTK